VDRVGARGGRVVRGMDAAGCAFDRWMVTGCGEATAAVPNRSAWSVAPASGWGLCPDVGFGGLFVGVMLLTGGGAMCVRYWWLGCRWRVSVLGQRVFGCPSVRFGADVRLRSGAGGVFSVWAGSMLVLAIESLVGGEWRGQRGTQGMSDRPPKRLPPGLLSRRFRVSVRGGVWGGWVDRLCLESVPKFLKTIAVSVMGCVERWMIAAGEWHVGGRVGGRAIVVTCNGMLRFRRRVFVVRRIGGGIEIGNLRSVKSGDRCGISAGC